MDEGYVSGKTHTILISDDDIRGTIDMFAFLNIMTNESWQTYKKYLEKTYEKEYEVPTPSSVLSTSKT